MKKTIRLLPKIVLFMVFCQMLSTIHETNLPGKELLFYPHQFGSANSLTNSVNWSVERVDAPRWFEELGDRSLQLDSAGYPHIAYGGYAGGDGLHYAWYDGIAWHYETVDDTVGVGAYASLALDSAGLPHISYYDRENLAVRYAHWTGSDWQIQTVGSTTSIQASSLALDINDNPHIAFVDSANTNLIYAHWAMGWDYQVVDTNYSDNPSLSLDSIGIPHISYFYPGTPGLQYASYNSNTWTWDIETVDIEGCKAASTSASMVFDSNDHPHISYRGCNEHLKYAYHDGTGWSLQDLGTVGNSVGSFAGQFSSIAVDNNNYPHISSHSQSSRDLIYFRWNGSNWELQAIDEVGDTGKFTSISLDASGRPRISYFSHGDGDQQGLLKLATWDGSTWSLEIADRRSAVGYYSSIAINADNVPYISYYDSTNKDLKYAYWEGSRWISETVDSAGDVGRYSSIQLDQSGYPYISYFDYTNGDLKLARWLGSSWIRPVIDSTGEVGNYSSLALDDTGNVHIVYADNTNKTLKYAHWNGLVWNKQILDDQGGDQGFAYSSIDLDSTGNPHVMYVDETNNDLKYAVKSGTQWLIETVDATEAYIYYPSLDLDASGKPHISYVGYDRLKYAHKDPSDAWIIVNAIDSVRGATSIKLDASGNPAISYYDYSEHLKFAYWDGEQWDFTVLDEEAGAGHFSVLTTDHSGNSHIAYEGYGAGDLKYARGLISGSTCNPSADQVALYTGIDYSDQCVLLGIGDYADPTAFGLPNDDISSLQIGSNVQVTLYKDDSFAGVNETFTSNDASLSDNPIGDNQTSSLRVQERPPLPPILSNPLDASSWLETTDIVLSWQPALRAISYQVELWGDSYPMTTPCNWTAATSCSIGQLSPGMLYWRVKARNASGLEGDWSATWRFEIRQPEPGDSYENDDLCTQASGISTTGLIQEHTFHDQADGDWLTFPVTSGKTYVIEGMVAPESPADLSASTYATCSDTPETQDYAFSAGFRIEFQAVSTGSTYLRVENHDPTVFGSHVSYQVSVREIGSEALPGALIIVAGRLTMIDLLQNNIHNVANRVYNIFRNQGYGDDRIYFMATNPSLPGWDANPEATALQATIETWARSLVAADRPLTLYLVDHGDANIFYLDKPSFEWITPSQLDGWLTNLEANVPGLKTNIILEACFSGSFIDVAEEISKPGRVVISSTSSSLNAYATANGALFSDYFLDALQQKQSLFASFQHALWAVLEARKAANDQIPWIDDNGDALVDNSDGTEAMQRGFAIAGTLGEDYWPPYIEQTLVALVPGQTSGTIQARVLDDLSVNYVYAVIYPPSYEPPAPGEALPIESLPTVTLLNQGNNWYGAQYTGFTEIGRYHIVIYAQDTQLLQAQPHIVNIFSGFQIFLPILRR